MSTCAIIKIHIIINKGITYKIIYKIKVFKLYILL